MVGSSSSGSDYTKFTVPQLKARCKELNITGYSKLGKSALLEKLSHYENFDNGASKAPAKETDRSTELVLAVLSVAPPPPHASSRVVSLPAIGSEVSEKTGDGASSLASTNGGELITTPSVASRQARLCPAQKKSEETMATKKRAADSAKVASPTPLRKRKLSSTSRCIENVAPAERSLGSSSKTSTFRALTQKPSRANPGSHRKHSMIPTVAAAIPAREPLLLTQPSAPTHPSSKRFQPLVPCPKADARSSPPLLSLGVSLEQLLYLDFSSAPSVPPRTSFQPITIPPTLSQRKRVNTWSVILSGLPDAERRMCTFVSRAIRYAVYLSAVPIITRVFGSRRFAGLPQKYNMAMTNFWPYLQQLRIELSDRRKAYLASFLPRFFGSHVPIAEHIWGCPDDDKELTVALRFLMTRIWFVISLNTSDNEKVRRSVVTDVREVVKDEIWKITVLTRGSRDSKPNREMFYVLESTCEVIGLPPPIRAPHPLVEASGSSEVDGRRRCLRLDWADYVEYRTSGVRENNCQHPLCGHLKSTNAEEYLNGISKMWLSRISNEGEIGKYKRTIAQRYVLACVVGNSVSGRWMSSTNMAQVFAGLASESDMVGPSHPNKREQQRVNLFLPAHHLVESVHVTTGGKKARDLHPAVAIVQTPGREYFILRDNGMEVGCEEDGVWPVWMELLDCDARGVACS